MGWADSQRTVFPALVIVFQLPDFALVAVDFFLQALNLFLMVLYLLRVVLPQRLHLLLLLLPAGGK